MIITIVLNEKEYAENCLKNRIIGEKPFFTLSILAKYYYHVFGYRKKKITSLLINFMSRYYPRYSANKSLWDENIEKIAKNAGKYDLFEIDGVWITDKELKTISNIRNKVLERLAFTMLCIAKLNNMKNPKNNGWVNIDIKDLFSIARISCSVRDRYNKLGNLKQLSLLEFPKKNDNLSSRVTYIDNNGLNILFISDFRELGYEYLKYCGGNFVNCQECGRLIRNNKYSNKKYCLECAAYTPKNYKTIVCLDCGKEFEIKAKNNKSCRCSNCYKIYRKNKIKENVQKYREKQKM